MQDRKAIETVMKPEQEDCSGTSQRTRSVVLWTLATVFSLVFNIILFDLMPCLVNRNLGRPKYSQYIETVNIVRVKRTEPPARKKEKKSEAKPKEQMKKLMQNKAVYQNRMMKRPVGLPFEINPNLTRMAGDLKIPPMEMARLGSPGPGSYGVGGDSFGLKYYGVGEIDQPLTALAQVPPIYPMRAKRMGIEGWVKVRFIVNEDGRVSDIKIHESSPEKIFDNAVVHCVLSWRFTPGTVENVPVKTWVETTIRFDLQ